MRRISITVSSLALLALALPTSSQAASAIDLGTARDFAVLAGAGVTNTGPTVVNGDLGTHPTFAVTGFGGAPNGTVNGVIHQADAVALDAKNDLTTAYNNAAGQGPPTTIQTDLGGLTLTPGVYTSVTGDFGLTGTLTLNAQGDPDAVFIFKSSSTLVTAASSQVNLINSAQSCRVYWQLGSSATLGAASDFVGNVLAQDSISVGNAVNVDGRLLARTASVTLINDTITRAQCAPGTPPPPPPPPPPDDGDDDGDGDGNGDGSGNGGGGPGGPKVHISETPGGGWHTTTGPRCADHGFRSVFRIESNTRLRSVKVFLDGRLIREVSNKRNFSAWIKVRGLRVGRHTVRVVATDVKGRRSAARKSFLRCAAAAPEPDFTGRTPATR